MKVFIFILTLIPATAMAGDFTLYFSGLTNHVVAGEYNEENPGIQVRYSESGWFVQSGFFLNSYNNWAEYAVVGPEWEFGDVTWSVGVGAVYGYERYSSNVMPFAAAMMEYKHLYVGIIPNAVTIGLRVDI